MHRGGVGGSHSPWTTGLTKMSSGRGHGVDPFPARRLHCEDMGPDFHQTQRPIMNMDDDFADDLHLGEYDAHGVHSQSREEAQHVRAPGTAHTVWDRDTNLGTFIPRGTSAQQSAPWRGIPGYAPRMQGYGHDSEVPLDQNRTPSMGRGDGFQTQSAVPWRMAIEDHNKRRRIQWQWTKPYLTEMASAHAKRRSPVVHVPTTTTGKAESEQMVALRALGPQKSSSLGSEGPASTSPPLSQHEV
ncbi:hypothetical protein M758_UG136800 [Ceratodon purpureus]|nr:hypothetical protein M758_UG136800 [Ceratodon purpureus]